MTVYQQARELAEEIMKTEEAIRFFNLSDNYSEEYVSQCEKAQKDYKDLVNEIFSIIKYTLGEEDILEQTSSMSCNHNCGGCKK